MIKMRGGILQSSHCVWIGTLDGHSLLSKTAFRCKERVSGKPMAKFIEDAEVLVLSNAPLSLNEFWYIS